MLKPLLSTRQFPATLEFAMAALRVGLGVLMLTHGWPKLEMLIDGGPIRFGDPIGIGKMPSLILVILAEFFCSVLLILGLLTRLATIPLIITMAVAVFIAHSGDPIGKKEMGLLYLLGYVAIFAYGSGRFSVDRLIGK